MTLHGLLAFTGLCVVLSLTPGADSVLVLRHSLRAVPSGVAVAAGSALGSLVWAAGVAVGVAALLEQSASAYRAVKIAGGLYLLYLGVSALLRSRHAAPAEPETIASPPHGSGLGAAWAAGLGSCVLNPKVGLFFLAVVPHFLPATDSGVVQIMTLGLIDGVVAFAYLAVLAIGSARAAHWLRRPRIARRVEQFTATVLAAFGVGTLASARP